MFNDSVLGASGRQSRRSGEAEVHLTRRSNQDNECDGKLADVSGDASERTGGTGSPDRVEPVGSNRSGLIRAGHSERVRIRPR